MGATTFSTFVSTQGRRRDVDAVACYKRAVEQAEWESGHDPYNGTISTTNGVAVIVRDPITITQARRLIRQYHEWEDAQYDDDRPSRARARKRAANPFGSIEMEKWGPALAIPIKRSHDHKRGWLFIGLAAM